MQLGGSGKCARRACRQTALLWAASTTLAPREARASERGEHGGATRTRDAGANGAGSTFTRARCLKFSERETLDGTMITGSGANTAKAAAGRRLASGMAQCVPAASAYGKCCAALGKDVTLGACAKEFEELRKCFSKANKRV